MDTSTNTQDPALRILYAKIGAFCSIVLAFCSAMLFFLLDNVSTLGQIGLGLCSLVSVLLAGVCIWALARYRKERTE